MLNESKKLDKSNGKRKKINKNKKTFEILPNMDYNRTMRKMLFGGMRNGNVWKKQL